MIKKLALAGVGLWLMLASGVRGPNVAAAEEWPVFEIGLIVVIDVNVFYCYQLPCFEGCCAVF